MLSEVSHISFPQVVRPKSVIDGPELVGYFDGTDNVCTVVVYL